MNAGAIVTVWLLAWLLCCCLTAYIAGRKGRYRSVWFSLAFFFQLVALIAVLLLPPAGPPRHSPRI